jgi:hypothetical protein
VTRRAIITLLVTIVAASVAFAAPPERRRGGIPPTDESVIAALLHASAPATDPSVSIAPSGSVDCINRPRADGHALSGKLMAHVGWYYQDCPTSPSAFRCTPGDGVFHLGTVQLGPSLVGVLFRAPGTFTSSVIDVWPFDTARRRWLAPAELVDNWGDPDDWYIARAWLVDLDGDGYRELVKREKIGAGGRLVDDRVVVRTGGAAGFGPERVDPSLRARFDFALACR